MYFKLIGCKIFEREIASVAYNCKNMLDVSLIKQKHHEKPVKLNQLLQEEIDRIDQNADDHSQDTEVVDYNAILLTYGLCSGTTMGLRSKKYPLVIPKVHDCVTMLLGSRDRFNEYYFSHPGTFYSSCGYTELAFFKNEEQRRRRLQVWIDRYKGDRARAERVMDMEESLMDNYKAISYIHWDTLPFPEYEEHNRREAEKRNWSYEILPGNNSIFRKLVDGEWDEDLFLVVPPGRTATESFDRHIIKLKEE